ncbi:DUF4395 domain-containing protein [Nocardioides sp.]|uniref:DUF4395 domain-containing protein n=1 Tax=Nocardioides sp. TaxID=35761 RepID=UPI001A2BB91E|nr:DUF4395 domain-containing protein [Nocardioides sp.]MBJ7357279.1 DUF4395 domain-containing protein [Nocardioides sp.]
MSVVSTPSNVGVAAPSARAGIDPRGPQFVAALTAVTVAAALLLPPAAGVVLAAVQAALFAVGATRGVQHTPQAWLFRTLVRPRLAPPPELEDPAPPRFAQAVGLVFTVVAVIGFAAGATLVAQIALGLALVASVLNAVFRFCLGCEMYLLIKRLAPA